jgi:hypothetical protein
MPYAIYEGDSPDLEYDQGMYVSMIRFLAPGVLLTQ